MKKKSTRWLAAIGAVCAAVCPPAFAADDAIRIGVLTDMTGLYSDQNGQGSVTAVKMAVEDFGGKVLGKRIEVIAADHQNKADLAGSLAREWFDTKKVDMIANLGPSHTALAIVDVAKQKNRIAISTGAAATRLTNEGCTPNSIHYVYDTYALANGTANAVTKQGGKSWYFVTADYVFGHALEKDASEIVLANGGKVVGRSRHPVNSSDFSSFILSAQGSGAQVIALANAGGDTINSLKTVKDFQVTKSGKQSVAAMVLFLTDVHSLGLQSTQGLLLTTAFYWDRTDETRKWSKRFFERMKRMPTDAQAGDYSSTLHYLKAIQAAKTDEASVVMTKMKATPINDMFASNGRIREDGRMVHDMYLAQVKAPNESNSPWDYFKIKGVIPAEQAFQPLSRSTCPLVKKG
jgi:branched-chain amino acid transport system substrate-binding protein